MNAQRFEEIVSAYGASAQRWPAAERAAAEQFAAQYPDIAQPMLGDATEIDGLLGGYRIAPADSALTGRIVASASRGAHKIVLFWRGLGLAGLAAAGALAGAIMISSTSPADMPFGSDEAVLTAFDNAPYDVAYDSDEQDLQ